MTDEPEGPDEYPTGDELPDEDLSPEDITPFSTDTTEFDDINDLATTEWKKSTTADERVRTVVKRTASPKTVREIAETAAVSETKARNALKSLVEEGVARVEQTESGAAYQRDPDRYLIEQIHELSMTDGLVDRIQAAKAEVAEYREQYDTDSPEELLVSDRSLTDEELTDVSHWRTTVRDLEYLRAAYRIRQAKENTASSGVPTRDSDSSHASTQ
ncbi:winged helix-turn-helix domain-containing protein [Halarchaeum sp. P4]|uniref:winged helix-turn-helix domain-containing protein n=1 Tax=Halarchaeum sp. P4 TaxID=3421639 RepID=UPI003EB912EA